LSTTCEERRERKVEAPEWAYFEVTSVEARSEARKRKTAASEIGAEERAASAQSVAKKVNLGEIGIMIGLSNVGTVPGQLEAEEESETTKAERKRMKNEAKLNQKRTSR
jgi:hypothetical protein